MPINRKERKEIRCHDCNVKEGEKHIFGCDFERCPFCNHQLIGCFCLYEILGIVDKTKYTIDTAYLPPSIYEDGPTDEQLDNFVAFCEEKGRYPYIQYPLICALCGDLWPDFFRVPDKEWKQFIQPDKRNEIICKSCYDYIKEVTLTNGKS